MVPLTIPPSGVLELQAIDADRGFAREWSIVLSRDLFGSWIIDTRWGRVGTKGQRRRVAHAVEADADRVIRRLLRRRHGHRPA